MGRRTSSPPQSESFSSAQAAQNVHSNEQIIALRDPGGRSQSQHSHPGRSSSIMASRQPLDDRSVILTLKLAEMPYSI
jgi:hypothetical protein